MFTNNKQTNFNAFQPEVQRTVVFAHKKIRKKKHPFRADLLYIMPDFFF